MSPAEQRPDQLRIVGPASEPEDRLLHLGEPLGRFGEEGLENQLMVDERHQTSLTHMLPSERSKRTRRPREPPTERAASGIRRAASTSLATVTFCSPRCFPRSCGTLTTWAPPAIFATRSCSSHPSESRRCASWRVAGPPNRAESA